jgi:hypothetical protein
VQILSSVAVWAAVSLVNNADTWMINHFENSLNDVTERADQYGAQVNVINSSLITG